MDLMPRAKLFYRKLKIVKSICPAAYLYVDVQRWLGKTVQVQTEHIISFGANALRL
jgi:hypothetical protein